MKFGISFNDVKSIFLISFGRLVEHIMSRQGIPTNPNKIAIIVSLPIPTLL